MAKHRRPYGRLSSPEGCRQDPARVTSLAMRPATRTISRRFGDAAATSIAPKLWDGESALWDVFPVQRWYLCVLPRSEVQAITTHVVRRSAAGAACGLAPHGWSRGDAQCCLIQDLDVLAGHHGSMTSPREAGSVIAVRASPAARQLAVSGPVRVAAMADGVDLYLVLGLVDAVDDPVGPPPGRVEAVERLVQRLACPVGVHGDRPLDCLQRGSSYLQGEVLANVAAGLAGQAHRVRPVLSRVPAHRGPSRRCSSSARTCSAL